MYFVFPHLIFIIKIFKLMNCCIATQCEQTNESENTPVDFRGIQLKRAGQFGRLFVSFESNRDELVFVSACWRRC